jgi:hypothetical protein
MVDGRIVMIAESLPNWEYDDMAGRTADAGGKELRRTGWPPNRHPATSDKVFLANVPSITLAFERLTQTAARTRLGPQAA